MSKGDKSKGKAKAKKATAKKAAPKGGRRSLVAPILGVFLIFTAGVGYFMYGGKTSRADMKSASADCSKTGQKRHEMRSPLPAELFVGRVRAAYAAARDIPEVLDQLYCYCHCKENIGHKSLLSCYTDNHAAGCDVCVVEAEMAAQMTAQGYCAAEIQQAIDKRFGKS